jgi:uncharacterized protein YndB with AHSA1/START domain
MMDDIIQVSPEQEIRSTRTFDYPQALIYRAWSEPGNLSRWWGPAGFTNTFNEFDFRVGGKWSFVMHGPDKGNYPNECEFIRIEEPSLIAWKRYSKPIFQVVATFEKMGEEKTLLTFRMLFPSVDDCRKVRPFATEKNEENFDKLERVLKDLAKN